MLAKALQQRTPIPKRDRWGFFYDGRAVLKGIQGGRPYPVFWLDMMREDKEVQAEDKILQRKKVGRKTIIEFCKLYIKQPERER